MFGPGDRAAGDWDYTDVSNASPVIAPDGSTIERTAEGMHARVVQHECDHLDGLLYPQRMDDLSLLTFESEWKHFGPKVENGGVE